MRGRTSDKRRPTARRPTIAGAMVAASLALPAIALGHLERPSYWPDPAPDTSVSPAAGGAVPKARCLASAVSGQGPGDVRVVCERGEESLRLAMRAIDRAETNGFRLRPSRPKTTYGEQKAENMRQLNRTFADRCRYHAVQAAVDDSQQQRPDRDHARPLHGAALAQVAGERPHSAIRRCSRRTSRAR